MKIKATLVLLAVFLLIFSSGVLSDDLYITNQGTYYLERGEDLKNADYAPDTYYLNFGDKWYHLERSSWKFPKTFSEEKGNEPEISVSSHYLLMEEFEIYDYKHCQFWQRSLSMFYSDIPKISGWVGSQSAAARRRFAGHYQKLHNHAEIHPTYLGNEIISFLKVYDRYSGGAHGINNFVLKTYTLGGEEVKVKDLFGNWNKVKHALKLSLLEAWVRRGHEFGNEVFESDREDLGMKLMTFTDMSGELLEELEEELGDRGFIFTQSEEGVKFNIYMPRYSLGANPLGGSWISIPIKEMPKIVKDDINNWLNINQLKGSLPEDLKYFSQKTQLYGIFPKPKNFNEEFLIGRIELEHKNGCVKELLDIIPKK